MGSDRVADSGSTGLRFNVSSNRLPLVRLMELLEPLRDCLTALDASQNDLGDASPQSLLRSLPVLRELHLSGCGVGAQGIYMLVAELRLQTKGDWMGIASPRSSPKSNQKNASRSSPKALVKGTLKGKLPQNSKADLEHKHAGLQILDLSACSIEAAVPELSAYLTEAACTLTALDLSFNVIGPEAMRHLGHGLRANSTLRSLRLAHCHLREDAATLFEDLSIEGSTLPLQHFCLARNNLSGNAYKELGVFLASPAGRRLETLDISGNSIADEFASRCLGRALVAAQSAKLRLDLSGTRQFFDPTFARWDVTTSHVLATLRLPSCRVLEVVLDQCTMLPEAAASTLARTCLNVRVFSFCGHAIGEAFVHALSELMKATLPSNGTRSSQPSTAAASPTSAIRSIPSDGVMPSIDTSSAGVFGGAVEDDIPSYDMLSSPRSVRLPHRSLRHCLCTLRLNDAALQDHSIVLLADALTRLRAVRQDGHDLEVLEVAGNHLSSESIDALGPIMVENEHLRRLVLSRNRLKSIGAARLSELLPWRSNRSTSLLELSLRHCSLTSEGCVQVWQAMLSDSSRVSMIDLAENALDGDGLQAMHDLATLHPQHALQQVNLLPNPCNTAAVVALLLQLTPWQRISIHEGPLDAQTIGHLLYSLGCERYSDDSVSSPRHPSPAKSGRPASPRIAQEAPPSEFALSLSGTSMVSKPWQWSIIADAIKTATLPAGSDAAMRKLLRSKGAPWRRHFGGVGAELVVELDRCELARVAFKAPSSTPVVAVTSGCSASTRSSLAKSARKEIRTRAPANRNQSAQTTQYSSLAARARSVGSIGRGLSLSSIGGDQEALVSPSSSSIAFFDNMQSARSEGVRSEECVELFSREVTIIEPRYSSANLGRRSQSASNIRSAGRPLSAPPIREVVANIATGTSSSSQQALAGPQPSNYSSSSTKVPKLEGIGRCFERKGHHELEVSTVLRELRNVETVRLESCSLGDRRLIQLCSTGGSSKWSGVRFLDLRCNDLTAGCCQALASVVSGGLEVLIVDGNQIRAEGLETLCAAVKGGSRCSLRWLSVADNDIGHPGGFVVAELLSRKSGCPLQGLSLARNPLLSSGELIAIFRAVCRQAAASDEEATERCMGRRLEVLDLSASGADTPVLPQLSRALMLCPALAVDLHGCPAISSGPCLLPELVQFVNESRLFL